jgi:hypothetical protein
MAVHDLMYVAIVVARGLRPVWSAGFTWFSDAFPAKLLEYRTLIYPFENLGFPTLRSASLELWRSFSPCCPPKSRSDQQAVKWFIVE